MVPPNYVKILFWIISTIIKKTGALSGAVQKIDFMGPHFGGFPGESPQKILGEKIAFAAQQLYAKIRFPCFVVWEKKSVQNLGRKKKKKEKNCIAVKSGLVGIKGYLKTYNHVKYFLPYLNCV